jgi:hypothetical protein
MPEPTNTPTSVTVEPSTSGEATPQSDQ